MPVFGRKEKLFLGLILYLDTFLKHYCRIWSIRIDKERLWVNDVDLENQVIQKEILCSQNIIQKS